MADPSPTPAPTLRGVLWANLVSLAVVLWYGVRYLRVALEARGHVAALVSVPNWYLYAAALLACASAIAVGVAAWLRKVPLGSKSYRLVPVLAVLVLALHVFLAPQSLLVIPADRLIAEQLSSLEAETLADESGHFAADPSRLAAQLEPQPPPFVDRQGAPYKAWRIVVRTDCTGPLEQIPAGTDPGTLLACFSADRLHLWLAAVGIGNALTGEPCLVKSEGQPVAIALDAPATNRADPDAGDSDPGP